jgi:hypothetical protein
MKFFRFLSIIVIVMALSALAIADTIKLKDGSVIRGKVIGFRDGQFIVIIGTGARARRMTFFVDEIESIEFDSNESQVATNENTNPKPNTPKDQDQQGTLNTSSKVTVVKSDPLTADNNVKVKDNPKVKETIKINVKVLADNTANGWTNAGLVVRKGQKIRVTGKGQIYLGGGKFCGPEGMKTLPDPEKLIPDAPTGALIAVIGDDNNDFIFIGAQNEFIAQREGTLFLGVNEGNLDDNSGAFDVIVEVEPENKPK